MIPSLLLALAIGYALGHEMPVEALALCGVAYVVIAANGRIRRDELAAMEPLPDGRWHFHDGPIRVIAADDPDEAIDRLLYPKRYVGAWYAAARVEPSDG